MKNPTLEEAVEITEFRIVEKPLEAKFSKASKYARILAAIKNLDREKAIEIPVAMLGNQSFQSFKFGLKQAAKKAAMLKVGAIQKHGVVYVYSN